MVFSDIHANLTALEAVLEDAGQVDAYWFLGDLVGYGPQPNECVERLRALPNLLAVMGNHDAAVLGKMPLGWFNAEARNMIVWTQSQLSPQNLAFLTQLPEKIMTEHVSLVHGSIRKPITEYIFSNSIAIASIALMETPFAFVGHTHHPLCWQSDDTTKITQFCKGQDGKKVAMEPKAIFNPGSVGQPRDGDPRAAYALYIPEEHLWEWRRVEYDISQTQNLMLNMGLSPYNALRLTVGK